MKKSYAWASIAALFALPGIASAQIVDHSNPSTDKGDLVVNQNYPWGPIFVGGVARLTDKGTSEVSTVFTREKVNITRFSNSFVFQIHGGGPGEYFDNKGNPVGNLADGFTFTIQNDSTDLIGDGGETLGYGAKFPKSIAIKFDTVQNAGDVSWSCTGLYVDGQVPHGGIDLLKDDINLRSQHPFRVDMQYDSRILTVQIADLETGALSTQSYPVNIPGAVGGRVAYVGFTAATGDGSSAQDLLKWYFASDPALASRGAWPKHRTSLVAAGSTISAWPITPVRYTRPVVQKTNVASAKISSHRSKHIQ